MEQVSPNKRPPPQFGETLRSPKKIKTDEPYGTEELHFCELFETVMDMLMKTRNITEKDVRVAIDLIIKSFHFGLGKKFSDIDYNELDKVCGYLSRYAVHNSGLVRNRILTAVQKGNILENEMKSPVLNVVSLGGGPGCDVIGFCSALCELHDSWQIEDTNPWHMKNFDLNITVIDKVKRWASCLSIADFLLREKNFGSVSKLFQEKRVSLRFWENNILNKDSTSYSEVLAAANVVIIARVIHNLEWEEKRQLKEILVQRLKPGTIILYIDTPFYEDMLEYFDVLYRSDEPDYAMSVERQRFSNVRGSKAQIIVLQQKKSSQ